MRLYEKVPCILLHMARRPHQVKKTCYGSLHFPNRSQIDPNRPESTPNRPPIDPNRPQIDPITYDSRTLDIDMSLRHTTKSHFEVLRFSKFSKIKTLKIVFSMTNHVGYLVVQVCTTLHLRKRNKHVFPKGV